MHTIHSEAHILQSYDNSTHIKLNDLFQLKIPALRGRGTANNILILEIFALEGPLLKYDIYKKLKERGISEYSTITRRIDSLREKGYLDKAGKRITKRGKQKEESMYGLTWRGFIASLVSNKVRADVLHVISITPLLHIPEKEFVLLLLEEILNPKEIELLTTHILSSFLKVIPNLENIEDSELFLWVFQALKEAPFTGISINKLSEKKKDLTKLLDNPRILQYVKDRILPMISEYESNFYVIYQFFKTLNVIGNFIQKLEPDNNPSERLKEYLQNLKLDEKISNS